MKKLFALILLCALCQTASAAVTISNLFTYGTVNNTTNDGTNVLIGTAYIATTPTFAIQSGGLTGTDGQSATNALVVYIQYGIGDTTNMTTVATYRQATTNAQDGVVTPSGITLNIYARARIVTTNSVNVGTKAIFGAN